MCWLTKNYGGRLIWFVSIWIWFSVKIVCKKILTKKMHLLKGTHFFCAPLKNCPSKMLWHILEQLGKSECLSCHKPQLPQDLDFALFWIIPSKLISSSAGNVFVKSHQKHSNLCIKPRNFSKKYLINEAWKSMLIVLIYDASEVQDWNVSIVS